MPSFRLAHRLLQQVAADLPDVLDHLGVGWEASSGRLCWGREEPTGSGGCCGLEAPLDPKPSSSHLGARSKMALKIDSRRTVQTIYTYALAQSPV